MNRCRPYHRLIPFLGGLLYAVVADAQPPAVTNSPPTTASSAANSSPAKPSPAKPSPANSWPSYFAANGPLLSPALVTWDRFKQHWQPRHRHPDDPARHRGIGAPLRGASWRNRPYHIDWLSGVLIGDNLIDGLVGQSTDGILGFRLGWDYDHYRSLEMRLAFARLDTSAGMAMGSSDVSFWDFHYLYYPLGDTSVRPFLTIGGGFGTYQFIDHSALARDETLFQLPMGVGVKVRCQRGVALRGEIVDNIAFGSGDIDTMHNWQFTVGMEFHFGNRPTSYFPFD